MALIFGATVCPSSTSKTGYPLQQLKVGKPSETEFGKSRVPKCPLINTALNDVAVMDDGAPERYPYLP
jgi:hypothetical protein